MEDLRKQATNANVKKLLKLYSRYKFVRLLLLNPVLRVIAIPIAAVILVLTWPFILGYIAFRVVRFRRRYRTRTKHRQPENVQERIRYAIDSARR